MDFTWYYFIGKTKLNLSFKETGRLTLRLFNKLYKHYKNDFDLENYLRSQKITYKELKVKSQQSEFWF